MPGPPMDSKELGSEIYETHPIPRMESAELRKYERLLFSKLQQTSSSW